MEADALKGSDSTSEALPGNRLAGLANPACGGEPLVVFDDVTIWYGAEQTRPIVANVNLSATAGELICVVGPSGCGKSTLLKALAGFTPIGHGSIRVAGVDIAGPGSDRGMVFQEFALFPWLDVEQNVLFGDKASKGGARERKERADHYLRLVGLAEFRHYYPSRLSGGMKQRVALARAWANQPRVLLMDEPFGALDARTRQELQDTLLKIFEEERTLCFFVTHDTTEAVYLSDRVVVMYAQGQSRTEVINVLPRPRNRHSEAAVRVVAQVDELAWRTQS